MLQLKVVLCGCSQFEPLIGDFLHEKEWQLGILSKMSNKVPKLDVTKVRTRCLSKLFGHVPAWIC